MLLLFRLLAQLKSWVSLAVLWWWYVYLCSFHLFCSIVTAAAAAFLFVCWMKDYWIFYCRFCIKYYCYCIQRIGNRFYYRWMVHVVVVAVGVLVGRGDNMKSAFAASILLFYDTNTQTHGIMKSQIRNLVFNACTNTRSTYAPSRPPNGFS